METMWTKRIEKICEKIGVTTDDYNENDNVKEYVAKVLGFETFEDFQRFPSPEQIIEGLALPLKEQDIVRQLELGMRAVQMVVHNYRLFKNYERAAEQINYLYRYLDNNFKSETQIAVTVFFIKTFKNETDQDIYDVFDKIDIPRFDKHYTNLPENSMELC
jgi:hypothetical protein